MKNSSFLWIVIAGFSLWFFSCTKEQASTLKAVLPTAQESSIGKWGVVNDSTFVGVGQNNHLSGYEGVSGDYFDFRADSNLYIREGSNFDTLRFSILPNHQLYINGFYNYGPHVLTDTINIVNFTGYYMKLQGLEFPTPGGIEGRFVNLVR